MEQTILLVLLALALMALALVVAKRAKDRPQATYVIKDDRSFYNGRNRWWE